MNIIMTTILSTTAILWPAGWVGFLSAHSHIPISARVGSSAVLPCELKSVSSQSPLLEWFIKSEMVFERYRQKVYQGEGYIDRVDVPEDELLKGNCSLVLKDIRSTDAGVYKSYLVGQTKKKLIQSVKLTVDETPDESFRKLPAAETPKEISKILPVAEVTMKNTALNSEQIVGLSTALIIVLIICFAVLRKACKGCKV